MLPEHLQGDSIHEIDKGVRELIVRLNRLPFLVTLDSCEGHLRKDFPAGIYSSGHLAFYADPSYIDAPEFIRGLYSLVRRYGFASITNTASSHFPDFQEGIPLPYEIIQKLSRHGVPFHTFVAGKLGEENKQIVEYDLFFRFPPLPPGELPSSLGIPSGIPACDVYEYAFRHLDDKSLRDIFFAHRISEPAFQTIVQHKRRINRFWSELNELAKEFEK